MTEPGSRSTAGLGPKQAGYATALRATLDGLDPVLDDLLLLERHEVSELLDRAPARELAGVLHSDPRLRRYLVARCPEVEPRMDALLAAYGPVGSRETARCAQAVV